MTAKRSSKEVSDDMMTNEAYGVFPVPAEPLRDAEGSIWDLESVLNAGPLVFGVYKCSCQASKTMFPFLERLHQRYRDHGLTVLGLSQDSANVARSFARRTGVTFPMLIEPDGFPISRELDITATPTVYVVRPDHSIAFTTMGFFKGPVNELGHAAGTLVDMPAEELFTADDADVPVFVPG